jgi:hypothetical protein
MALPGRRRRLFYMFAKPAFRPAETASGTLGMISRAKVGKVRLLHPGTSPCLAGSAAQASPACEGR